MQKKQELISKKEINLLENYIALQSLRISPNDPINISFIKKGNWNGQKIAPLLLIPFAENAFKHGISLNKPSFIQIELNLDGANLLFQVKNSLNLALKNPNDRNNGIGLQNVKERLTLLYPKKHQLWIDAQDHYFSIKLLLNLSQ